MRNQRLADRDIRQRIEAEDQIESLRARRRLKLEPLQFRIPVFPRGNLVRHVRFYPVIAVTQPVTREYHFRIPAVQSVKNIELTVGVCLNEQPYAIPYSEELRALCEKYSGALDGFL